MIRSNPHTDKPTNTASAEAQIAPRITRTTLENMDITPARAIRVRFLGPTNHKGARVKLSDPRGIIERPIILGFDHSNQGSIGTATAFLREHGWDLLGAHAVEMDGDILIVLRLWTARDSWKAGDAR